MQPRALLRDVPGDYWPVEAGDLKPKGEKHTPILDRLRKIHVVDFRTEKEIAETAAARALQAPSESAVEHRRIRGIPCETFKAQLFDFSAGIKKWAKAVVPFYMFQELHAKYPGKVMLKGQPVKTTKNFVRWLKQQTLTNELRGILFFLMVDLWNANDWNLEFETEFGLMLGFRFTDELSDGTIPDQPAKGKCIAKILVRKKNTLCGTVRDNVKKIFKESPGIQARPEGKARATGNNNNIPRMIYQLDVKEADMGFTGKLCICEGHYWADRDPKKSGNPTPAKLPATSRNGSPDGVSVGVSVVTDVSQLTPMTGTGSDADVTVLMGKMGGMTKEQLQKVQASIAMALKDSEPAAPTPTSPSLNSQAQVMGLLNAGNEEDSQAGAMSLLMKTAGTTDSPMASADATTLVSHDSSQTDGVSAVGDDAPASSVSDEAPVSTVSGEVLVGDNASNSFMLCSDPCRRLNRKRRLSRYL